jgi:hypothetical protein
MPGGPLTSKPTWSNTQGCSTTSAFFVLAVGQARLNSPRQCCYQSHFGAGLLAQVSVVSFLLGKTTEAMNGVSGLNPQELLDQTWSGDAEAVGNRLELYRAYLISF